MMTLRRLIELLTEASGARSGYEPKIRHFAKVLRLWIALCRDAESWTNCHPVDEKMITRMIEEVYSILSRKASVPALGTDWEKIFVRVMDVWRYESPELSIDEAGEQIFIILENRSRLRRELPALPQGRPSDRCQVIC